MGLVLAHLLTGFAVVFPGRPLCPAALAASGCGLAALLALAAILRLDPGTLPPAGDGDGGDEDATEAAALLPAAAGHCRTCGVRRPGLDHHCALLDACVAAGNRGPFLLLVASAAAGAAVLLAAAPSVFLANACLWLALGACLLSPREQGETLADAYPGTTAAIPAE